MKLVSLLPLALIAVLGCSVLVAAAVETNKNSFMKRSQTLPASGSQKWAKFTNVNLRCTREDGNVYKWCTTVFYGRLPSHCELIRVGCTT